MCNINIIYHQNTCKLIVNVHLNNIYRETNPSPLDHVFSGALPAPLWKCWPRNLHGPSTKPWQPFLRSPPSPRSPRSRRACPTHAGTSCGRCSWRRSGVPLQMFCSATRSSRAASEASQMPPITLPGRPLAAPAPSPPLRPAPPPGPHRRHHSPGLSITSTSCHAIYHQCLPCRDRSATRDCHKRDARLSMSDLQSCPRRCSVALPGGKPREST